jgi:RNA polymerase sigma-70 factor, ECF subfamily
MNSLNKKMEKSGISHSDMEIIQRVLDGQVNSFETLINRYRGLVLTIAARHVPHSEVEEIAQNIFIRAYQSLPIFQGKGEFKQWLSSIAIKTCYDYWRKAYRSNEIPMSSLSEKHIKWLEQVTTEQSMSEAFDRGRQKEAAEVLDWALGKLSAEDRMVIELLYMEECSGKEAAELLGWSVPNVKVRSFRAKKRLHKILKNLI